MTEQDRGQFFGMITVMAETFRETLSTPRVEIYWRALADMPLADVTRACEDWLRQGHRFPVPAQLRELVTGTTDDRAASAWAVLWEAGAKIDCYDSLLVSDPALAFALEATFRSWPGFCGLDLSPEMWAAKRKEFTLAYRAGLKRDGQAKQFAGLHEQANGTKGYALPPHVAGITTGHQVERTASQQTMLTAGHDVLVAREADEPGPEDDA